jgi:hypothetical protein
MVKTLVLRSPIGFRAFTHQMLPAKSVMMAI